MRAIIHWLTGRGGAFDLTLRDHIDNALYDGSWKWWIVAVLLLLWFLHLAPHMPDNGHFSGTGD